MGPDPVLVGSMIGCAQALVLGDLGDGAGRASVKAGAAGDAGVTVGDGGDVLELEDAGRAGVDADTAGDALVSINDRMSHNKNLLRYARRHIETATGLSVQ